MTTYTTVPNSDIDQDSPVTVALTTALRDNPLAIQEGDASAPKIQYAALDTWYSTVSAVGTYGFLKKTFGGGVTAGTSYAASGLVWSGTNDVTGASIASGTWLAMGTTGVNGGFATLMLRIA